MLIRPYLDCKIGAKLPVGLTGDSEWTAAGNRKVRLKSHINIRRGVMGGSWRVVVP